MKFRLLILFMLFGMLSFAQEASIKKPDYVIVANDTIITKEQLNTFAKDGYIKRMNKGVSQDYRDELATEYGDKIGDREFIITLDLFTEEERTANQIKVNNVPQQPEGKWDEGLILHINDSAKDFTVQMTDGKTITLSDLKGKVVLLNFWATWCAPCLMEFHEMPDKILKPFKDSDFVFLPISRGETAEKVTKKLLQLQEKGIDFNSGLDPETKIWDQYATKYIPKNFIIDKDGIIRYISTGNSEGSVDALATEIKTLLQH